ncbi:putative entry exclusion protein TrbK-alt [Phyllobacterium sp. K27]
MDLKIAARMVAVLAVGAAMTAAVMALRGDGPENGTEDAPAQSLHHPGGEPANAPLGRGELARCRDLGLSAAQDAACRKAWAENRRRFFGGERPERPPAPKPERFGKARPADPVPASDDHTPPGEPDARRLPPEAGAGSEAAIDEEPDGE